MEKAQHLLPHPPMPSKTTWVLVIVMLHVLALAYLTLVLYRAARWASLRCTVSGHVRRGELWIS